MKVSLNWLREFVEVGVRPQKLKDDLKGLGLGAESVSAADEDWVLEIDPDERLVGNIRGAIPAIPCDIVSMRVVDVEGHSLYYSRLFKKKKGMSFATHHSLHYEQGVDVEQYNGKAPENFYIRHERVEV